MQAPTLLAVLGMHRSGTSAVTGALSRLGFALGRAVVPPADDNPMGYFENAEAVDINEALLLGLGRGWDDVRPLPAGWRSGSVADAARLRIAAWLEQDIAGADRVVLKDPRLCLTFPLWREVLEASGCALRVILAHRSMAEVAASLARRDGLSERHALLLGLRHVLQAEAASRGLPRTVSRYDVLMAAPEAELSRVLGVLGFDAPNPGGMREAVGGFDRSQRRHRGLSLSSGQVGLLDVCEAVDGADAWDAASGPGGYPDAFLERVDALCAAEAAVLQPGAVALNGCRRNARALADHVRALDDALATTRRMALERLRDSEALDHRLKQVEDDYAGVASLALERLAEIGALDRALVDTREGLAQAEALALERLARCQSLEQALAEARSELATMEASWSWRITSPFRRIVAMFRGASR